MTTPPEPPGRPPYPPPAYPPPVPEATGPRAWLEYHLLLRAGERGLWRYAVGLVLLAVLMYVVAPIVLIIPFIVWYVVQSGGDGAVLRSDIESLVDTTDPTPATLAYLLLSLSAAIPLTWLVVRTLHGLKPRWLASVRPRIRWRFLLACVGISVVALLVNFLLSAVVPAPDAGGDISGDPNAWSPTMRDFLLVILLLTPLQAVGEEYAFRGYLTQAFGGLFGSRTAAVIGPAVLFALAHGLGQSVPIFIDRLAFGLVAGVLVILTGGLEAGIAFHVLNNWVAFTLAAVYLDMGDALNPTGGSWWDIPVTVVKSLVYVGLAVLVARRMGLTTTADPAVLEASRRRV
jgi:CAAX protease family protein